MLLKEGPMVMENSFESFEEFKDQILKDKETYRDWQYEDFTPNDFKSGAVIRELSGLSLGRRYIDDLIRAIPIISEKGEYNPQEARFWSKCAGDLGYDDAQALIRMMESSREGGEEYYSNMNELYLTFSIKNGVAWEHYGKWLLENSGSIDKVSLLYALSSIQSVDEKFMPLINKVLGEVFTKLYLENKELIDRTPRKWNFTELEYETLYRRRNFLDAYTHELKILTESFGQNSNDYECLSKALEKEGFMEAAEELAERMLKRKDRYATADENGNSNYFIRENFPEIVEKVEKAISFKCDRKKLEEISDICFKEARIAEQIRKSGQCGDIDSRFVRDVVQALPDNMEQVLKAKELFNKLNERPETYGSDYNHCYPGSIVPLIKCGVEEWMYPVVLKAMNAGVISKDRLGSKVHLFDAARAWRINPKMWKKEAEMVGKMPLEARMVAGALFGKITENAERGMERNVLRDVFWAEMKEAQDMGWKKAMIHYCEDNAKSCGRFLSVYHPEYAEETRKMLATSVHLKDLVDLDMDRMLFNAGLWQRYFGIDKQEIFVNTDINFDCPACGEYDKRQRHQLIRRLAVYEKLFPNEEFRQKYLDYVAEKSASSTYRRDKEESVMWFPHFLSDEKMASFAKFLEEELFYDNRFGLEEMRPVEQLEGIGKIWGQLSKEEEQAYGYEKLLGMSYMQNTIKCIEDNFDRWIKSLRYINTGEINEDGLDKKRVVSVGKMLNISDGLDLYQKALLCSVQPKTREEVDKLLAMPRREGVAKISNYYSSEVIVDLVIGDDGKINRDERKYISQYVNDGQNFGDFDSKIYKKIFNNLMSVASRNLFQSDIPVEDQSIIEKGVLSAVKCMFCLGNDYQQYFDKIEKYNSSVDEKHRISSLGAVEWMPTNFRREDQESFKAFIDKYMFYDDGNKTIAIRPFDQLKKIGEMWHDLEPAQREFNYEKLLGLSYTKDTVIDINRDFKRWWNETYITVEERIEPAADNDEEYNAPAESDEGEERPRRRWSRMRREKFKHISEVYSIPDNLRLYQKLLLKLERPKTQEKINECLSYNRREGMIKIAELAGEHDNEKRKLVDLTVGNDAQINDYERDQIAGMSVEAILNFDSKHYREIVDKIMGLLDAKSYELFRKYYADMTAENVHTDNSDIIGVREQYRESRVWIAQSAVRCMQCYGGDYPRFFNRIAEHNISVNKAIYEGKPNVSQNDIINVHDALYWLPDNLGKKDRQSFKEFVDKYLFYKDENKISRHRDFSEFESVAKAWSSLSKEDREMDYDYIVNTIQARKYTDCKYLKFGRVAKECLVPDYDYKRLEKIYEQGLQVPELIDSTKRFRRIYDEAEEKPELINSKDRFKPGTLVGRFLPRDDPRALFFGKYTYCCQHYNGAGKACAISSVRDPFSALFVVEKANGEIVAGSWVWESKIKKGGQYYKALCFDNIEAKGDDYKFNQEVIDVYEEALPYLASLNYAKVTVGMGYQDGKVDHLPVTERIPMNRSYSGYSDAGETQKLFLDNPNATPVDYNEGDIYVTGALMEDISGMQSVSDKCFPEGDRALQVPDDDPQGLVLRDKGKIVGYVVYSEKEHSIYDMAVLPEYRSKKMKMPDGTVKNIEYKGGSRSSSLILLEAMAKKIKEIGSKEKWTAELRDITSFKYMKFMAARGLIDMEEGGIDHTMSDGTQVIKVKFSINDTPKPRRENGQDISVPVGQMGVRSGR